VRNSAAALAAGSAGTVLIGCGGKDVESGNTPVDFLSILNPEGLTFAPELLGIAGGYFADQGLDVTLQQTRGSGPAIQQVIAGNAPLTRIEQIEGVIHLANRQVPITNVGTFIRKPAIRFVSSSRAPIREPADFRGKLAGIPSEGGSTDKTLDLVLSNAGINPQAVERQVVGYSAGTFDLVQRGDIGCYGVSIDVAKILEQQRDDVVVFNPGDFISSGSQFYMVSNQGLIEHRDVIRRYLEAINAAIEFMIDDDGFEQTLVTLRSRYSFATLQDTGIARASLEEYVDIWTADGRDNLLRTSPDAWLRGYEELVAAGLAESGHEPAAWFTNEFVPAR
jgi:NitT/TauT family transport system substrate-binding protein